MDSDGLSFKLLFTVDGVDKKLVGQCQGNFRHGILISRSETDSQIILFGDICRDANFPFCIVVVGARPARLREAQVFVANRPIDGLSILAVKLKITRDKTEAAAQPMPHGAAAPAFVSTAERQG